MSNRSIRYLNRQDIESLEMGMPAVMKAVESALIEKAHRRTHMPAKHWMEVNPGKWFGTMSSVVPAVNSAAVKWQSGCEDNPAKGWPYITGLLILNDLDSGSPVAVMDSTWITAMRTAAESAIAAKHLALEGACSLGMIGCGVQARTHIEALRLVRPGLKTVYAFDIDPEASKRYAEEVRRRYDLEVVLCRTPWEAVVAGDIVVTAGPIERQALRAIGKGWLKSGGLAIPIDYDCYWMAEAFSEMDLLLTDDQGQLTHLAEHGYFADAPTIHGELGDVVASLHPGRTAERQKIMSINMGVAVEDATTARYLYEVACEREIGTLLPL